MPKHNTTTGLTLKEERFIAEYLIDGNGTRAAKAAGYSERTAYKAAQELIRRPRVEEAIRKALEAQQARTLITADQVLLDIKEIGDKALAEGKFEAALKSRELLGKHYKLFTDKHELTGKDGGLIGVAVEFVTSPNP